jgi:hypothetical protein
VLNNILAFLKPVKISFTEHQQEKTHFRIDKDIRTLKTNHFTALNISASAVDNCDRAL